MKLFDLTIKNSKPGEKPYRLSDGKGLHVLVHPNGSKYWQFRYRFAERERAPLSLGKYPEVSLSEARDRRDEAKRLIRDGIDPNEQRKQELLLRKFKDRNSFELVAEEWHERNEPRWTPDHAVTVWRRLENHVFPSLAKRPIAEITPIELLGVIQKIESKGSIETAHRVLHICDGIFRHAIITARTEINHAPNLRGALKPNKISHFPAIPAEELPRFLHAFEEVSGSFTYKLAFRLLSLTAVRTGELRQARWSDIDLTNDQWLVRAETTKLRREHLVPLSRQSCELLRSLKKLDHPGEWLFPNSQSGKHPIMSENAINNIIARMGYRTKMVGHGFRSLFSTIANEANFNPDAIERQLAHVEKNPVRAAYNRAAYLPERVTLMQWWADFLDKQRLA